MSGTDRSGWRIRVLRLTDAPADELPTATAAERVEMIWPLTVRAWRLSGRELPRTPRDRTPVRVLRPTGPGS